MIFYQNLLLGPMAWQLCSHLGPANWAHSELRFRFFIAPSKFRDFLLLGQKSEMFYCSVKNLRILYCLVKSSSIRLGFKRSDQAGADCSFLKQPALGQTPTDKSGTSANWANSELRFRYFLLHGKKSKIFYWSGCSFLIKAGLGQTSTVKFGTSDFDSLSSVLEGVSGLDCEYISPAKILNGSPV